MGTYTYIPSNHNYRIRKIKEAKITHGLTEHPVYNVWSCIKGRCYNPNNPAYKNYGSRGVRLYEPWGADFVLFYDYVTALPNYNKKGYSLDRIDNDGDYEPGNLRWATRHIQATNTRPTSRNTSGYIGVQKMGGAWVAGIRIKGEWIYLGRHKKKEDAVRARNKYIIDNGLTEYAVQGIK